jgi:hypothetical protein
MVNACNDRWRGAPHDEQKMNIELLGNAKKSGGGNASKGSSMKAGSGAGKGHAKTGGNAAKSSGRSAAKRSRFKAAVSSIVGGYNSGGAFGAAKAFGTAVKRGVARRKAARKIANKKSGGSGAHTKHGAGLHKTAAKNTVTMQNYDESSFAQNTVQESQVAPLAPQQPPPPQESEAGINPVMIGGIAILAALMMRGKK